MIKRKNDGNLKDSKYMLDVIILIMGVLFFILAYALDTYPEQYLEWILFFVSIPMIGIGYIRLTNRLDLNVACLVEGGVAFSIPLLFSSLFIIGMGWGVNIIVFSFVFILSLASLLMGISGFYKIRSENDRSGKRLRIVLKMTLVIGILFSFVVVVPPGF
jgi:uncharacterized membrane protein